MKPVQSLQKLNLLNYVDPTTHTHHSIRVEVSLTESNILKVKPLDPKLEGVAVDIQLGEAKEDFKGELTCKFSMSYTSQTSLDVAEFGQAIISLESGTVQSKNKTFSLKQA